MTVTTDDVTAALIGTTVAAGGLGNPGFQATQQATKPNPDGSYTIGNLTLADPTLGGNLVFTAFTFPDGSKGIQYTNGIGSVFHFKVVAFTETQVLLQDYTPAGVEAVAVHAVLTDGGPAPASDFPLTLYTTGASYQTPATSPGAGTIITGAPCFGRGTMIATLDGDVAVEDLREGDLVLTVSGEAKPLVWTGSRSVNVARHPRPENVRPVCIRRGAFSPNVPSRDLIVSPDHNVFVDGVLIPAKCLVNGRNVVLSDAETVDYHHIELASHDVVYAEGLEVETYLDTGNRTSFANEGVVVAHPDFSSAPDQNYFAWEAAGYARLVLDGPELDRTRSRLAERADELATHEAQVRRRA